MNDYVVREIPRLFYVQGAYNENGNQDDFENRYVYDYEPNPKLEVYAIKGSGNPSLWIGSKGGRVEAARMNK